MNKCNEIKSLYNYGSLGCCRLEFEARNQKKEAKELAVLEVMKRREEAAQQKIGLRNQES